MIWTDNYKQVPAGSLIAKRQKFSGHFWEVYTTADKGYVAFVPSVPLTRGTLGFKAMLSWLRVITRGRGRKPSLRQARSRRCFV